MPVEFQAENRTVGESVRLFDWEHPDNNDWLAVNQFTVIENHKNRRADVVVFVNGLPLAVLELKNLADENATIHDAFKQLGTYKADVPGLFAFNEALVISDGVQARIGSLTANREWFMPWRTVEGEALASTNRLELETLLKGVFEKRRFLDLIRNFVVFETDGAKVAKKMAGYHQFHAVNKAVGMAVKAASPQGNRRVGVVWHTQGSGKSLSMLFFAGKIIQHPAMANPTLVLLTDRNDLDGQLFDSFSAGKDLLRQTPEQAQSRDDLRRLLRRAAGGVVFTTIHKFVVEGGEQAALSDRRNIICIADEAHRSQYDFIDGFARRMREALPNASFIGFTGTPIELTDKNTRAVFGEYIDIYDIQRAVEDGATLRIYYEARLAMRGHGLMQTIARVNRVYKDKQGGLIVDYLGIAEELKKALSHYTDRSREETGIPQEEAVAVMLEKYEVVLGMYHGFNLTKIGQGSPAAQSTLVVVAMNHILGLDDGKSRYFKAVMELCQAFALSVPHERALAIREADRRGEDLGLNQAELAFYEALEVNDSAVKVLGDAVLKAIAQELVDSVRKNATIDWTVKENVRAKMRVHIRRILKKHGYPPDMQEKATQTVLEQAELMAEGLVA